MKRKLLSKKEITLEGILETMLGRKPTKEEIAVTWEFYIENRGEMAEALEKIRREDRERWMKVS